MQNTKKAAILMSICALTLSVALPVVLFFSVAHFNLTDMEPVSVIKPKFELLAPRLPAISAAISGCVSTITLIVALLMLRAGKSLERVSLATLIALLAWNGMFILGEPALYFLAIYASTQAYEHHLQLGKMLQLVLPVASGFSFFLALVSAAFAIVISALMFRKKAT